MKAALQHEGPRTESCGLEPTTRRHQSPRHRSSSRLKEPHGWDEERAPSPLLALGWDSAGVAPSPCSPDQGQSLTGARVSEQPSPRANPTTGCWQGYLQIICLTSCSHHSGAPPFVPLSTSSPLCTALVPHPQTTDRDGRVSHPKQPPRYRGKGSSGTSKATVLVCLCRLLALSPPDA